MMATDDGKTIAPFFKFATMIFFIQFPGSYINSR